MHRHDLDPLSLVAGLLFTGLGLLFLVGEPEAAVRLRWLWPVLLLGLGLAILLGARPRRPAAGEAAAADQRPDAPTGAEPETADLGEE